MMVGALGGCGDGAHPHQHRGCFLVREVEPNDTVRTTPFLEDIFVDDGIVVTGTLLDAAAGDRSSVLMQERRTLVVTLDHSAQVDFARQRLDAETGQLIRDGGSGAGPYTLTLDAP